MRSAGQFVSRRRVICGAGAAISAALLPLPLAALHQRQLGRGRLDVEGADRAGRLDVLRISAAKLAREPGCRRLGAAAAGHEPDER